MLFHLFREPKSAKKLGSRLIPGIMDEYNQSLIRYQSQTDIERLNNPIHFISCSECNGTGERAWRDFSDSRDIADPPLEECTFCPEPIGTTYQLVLNIAATASVDDSETLLRYVLRTQPDSPTLRRLVDLAFEYYHEHLRGDIERREPTDDEIRAIRDLVSRLKTLGDEPSEEAIQFEVYEVGKTHYSKERLREWFKAIYEIVLGQESGPRFGAFAAMFGIHKTIDLLELLVDRLTIAEFVDRYIAGEWREGAPPEVLQFAINHALEIENEFNYRTTHHG